MKALGVIPARWGSTRLEGKVLADVAGKPMIEHVWRRAKESSLLDDVLIACDEERILKAAEGFGAKAVLTKKDHPSGTDRIAEAVQDVDADLIVNIQGDEPLIHHCVIDDLIKALTEDQTADMATVIKLIDDLSELDNPNIVKVVIDQNKNALYFSRSAIPFNRSKKDAYFYKHLGIYAYQKKFLLSYTQLPKSGLEKIEQLEQLRALEAGFKIKTVMTDINTIGVDTPEDLKRVNDWLAQ